MKYYLAPDMAFLALAGTLGIASGCDGLGGLTINSLGGLFVTDAGNNRIRKIE